MKIKDKSRDTNIVTALLVAMVIILSGILLTTYVQQDSDSIEKAHDAIRISDIENIHQAVNDYYVAYGLYPACLYKGDCSHALEDTAIMPSVPVDPVTHLNYSYASFGTGDNCQGYHLGASLERTGSDALLTGADSVAQPASALCAGSKPDFSGISYAPGGQPCNATPGLAAPADGPTAETCYDLEHIHKTVATTTTN